jgi:MFS family permease
VTQFIRPPPYSLSDTAASLFYLAPIVGSIVGELWGHWFNDFLCKRYLRKHNGKYEPEDRLWGTYIGFGFSVSALVLYGQTLAKQLPVIGLAAAWALESFAAQSIVTAINAYVLDSFPGQAAGVSSWFNFWRTTGECALH